MAILPGHVQWYEEIFSIPGFFQEPVLIFGFQDFLIPAHCFADSKLIPNEYQANDLVAFLAHRGIKDVGVLDYFDPRAQVRYDMNRPVPISERGRYGTFIDIGCLEHVFDSRQCLENCLRMVKTGGMYLLHTPVKGYHGHGLHTFHPQVLTHALTLNGFEIVYQRYTTSDGKAIDIPDEGDDVLIWLVGRQIREIGEFVCPQQSEWEAINARLSSRRNSTVPVRTPAEAGWRTMVRLFAPPIVLNIYRAIRSRGRP